MSSESPDGAEQMRLAFEQFMLTGKTGTGNVAEGASEGQTNVSGKRKKKKKKGKRRSEGQSPLPVVSAVCRSLDDKEEDDVSESTKAWGGGGVFTGSGGPRSSPSPAHTRALEQQARKFTRRYWQLFRAFCGKIADSWIPEDDRLRDVVESIAGIRARLSYESSLRSRLAEDGNRSVNDGEWKLHGYGRGATPEDRARSGGFLTASDAELALSHDLCQHEKMLSAVRVLTSNLSTCHEFLGRKLDEMMRHHLDCASMFAGGDDPSLMSSVLTPEYGKCLGTALVEYATAAFRMLSMELYRKQCMAEAILQVNDTLFRLPCHSGGTDNDDASYSRVASRCLKAWPRGSEESCIDQVALSNTLRTGLSKFSDSSIPKVFEPT